MLKKEEREKKKKKKGRRRKKEEERNNQQFGSEGREFKLHQCHVGLFSSGQLLLRDPMGRLGPQSHIFHILFYCLNSLVCHSFSFLFVLNVSLLLGTADAEILRSPLLKTQS